MPTDEKVEKRHKMLGELLIEVGLISPEQLTKALEEQKRTGALIGEILIERGYIDKRTLGEILEYKFDIPYVNLSEYEIDPNVVQTFPVNLIKEYFIFPLKREDDSLYVAMASPSDILLIDKLSMLTGSTIVPLLTTKHDVEVAIRRYFSKDEVKDILKDVEAKKKGDGEIEDIMISRLEKILEGAPTVKMVDTIIKEAVSIGASDIHFEPQKNDMRVRYRIDGLLYEKMVIPQSAQPAIISRLKVMAGMNIAERRAPQDGRMTVNYENREIDVRVATLLTTYGESMVMRLLDKTKMLVGMDKLGFLPDQEVIFEKLLRKSYGMILVTGPTGSGKTTTLYTALQYINKITKKIITIEDPVEYQLSGVNQIQVNQQIGVTFSTGLRTILRLDPDVIMVGEIRDVETAKIAIEAALTGHLVFSTLHTNDAPSAGIRLLEMGVEPFLIASSIVGVVAQRLVRLVCPNCKEKYKPSSEELGRLGIPLDSNIALSRGKGCKECNDTGYKGRSAVFEVMALSELLCRLILSREPAGVVKQMAVREGMKTLQVTGLEKVKIGATTPEEVFRVVYAEA